MPTLDELLAQSPMFANEHRSTQAEAERLKRRAEEIARHKQVLAAGDLVYKQSQVVSERKRHLERLRTQLIAVRQEGERPAGLTRFGRTILVGEQPDHQERVRRCEGAVHRCQAEVEVEQSRLDELTRLARQLEQAPTA